METHHINCIIKGDDSGMSSKKKAIRQRILESAQIPEDLSRGAVLLQITGREEVYIENFRGILEYTEAEQYTKVIQEAATKCDYLIVYDHEGKGDANGVESYQKEHAAAFLQAGADIVIGGHSDRLQGIEYIDGKPVVYSIGSVLTDGTSRYSAVLKLNITSEGLKEMSFVPGIQTEDMTEYLDSAETQKKMYDAVAALCPNASIDENGVVTEKK